MSWEPFGERQNALSKGTAIVRGREHTSKPPGKRVRSMPDICEDHAVEGCLPLANPPVASMLLKILLSLGQGSQVTKAERYM